jgi:hypothetical protein
VSPLLDSLALPNLVRPINTVPSPTPALAPPQEHSTTAALAVPSVLPHWHGLVGISLNVECAHNHLKLPHLHSLFFLSATPRVSSHTQPPPPTYCSHHHHRLPIWCPLPPLAFRPLLWPSARRRHRPSPPFPLAQAKEPHHSKEKLSESISLSLDLWSAATTSSHHRQVVASVRNPIGTVLSSFLYCGVILMIH